mgnify:FL=1
MRIPLLLLAALFSFHATAQTARITGTVTESGSNAPVPFANVVIQNTTTGTTTDVDGAFELAGLDAGLYNIVVTSIGYEPATVFEVEVTNAKPAVLEIELSEAATELEEVVVTADPFRKPKESPLSLRSIGTNEIKRYPGGNRDISKVIQSLPGLVNVSTFRNDILIRGGAPSENVFYIDDIEVPTINHFSTQGASGGPVGVINVDFIRNADLYTGAFPVNRGNAMSSVLEIDQRAARTDRFGLTLTSGTNEAALSVEGPMGRDDRTEYLASVRYSYLQGLFKIFGLPFLPTYTDFQFKTRTRFSQKHELLVLGLGAVDQFRLNPDANETVEQRYLLDNLPNNGQWNYTIGGRYKYFTDDLGYMTLVLSHSALNNFADKYIDNDESDPDNLILDFQSLETETKLRAEHTFEKKGFRVNYGLGYEYTTIGTDRFTRDVGAGGVPIDLDYDAFFGFHQYAAFAQASRSFARERLDVSVGVRVDGNSSSWRMRNPFQHVSPRLSLSYKATEGLRFNFNTGWYHQIPASTLISFRSNDGERINRDALDYQDVTHVVGGVEYTTRKNSTFSAEGFFKYYRNYPLVSVGDPLNPVDTVSLGNLGADFGAVGFNGVPTLGDGRSYGLELLFQQKLFKGWYSIISYTLFKSEFQDKTGTFRPSAWDTRHAISLTLGKKFPKNWEIGGRWIVTGPRPFTPVDSLTSSLVPVWDANQQAIPDYDRVNAERLPWAHFMDIRVTKRWNLEKVSIETFLDIQNVYNFQAPSQPLLVVDEGADGSRQLNAMDPRFYDTSVIQTTDGTLIPGIGFILEY